MEFPRKPMGALESAVDFDVSVPVTIYRADPQPASVGLFDFGEKRLCWRLPMSEYLLTSNATAKIAVFQGDVDARWVQKEDFSASQIRTNARDFARIGLHWESPVKVPGDALQAA